MIVSFADKETENIFNGVNSKKARKRLHSALWEKAQTKLDILNRAHRLDGLKVRPNNRLEKLERDLDGKHRIRINDQYRIIFKWDSDRLGALELEITDYD